MKNRTKFILLVLTVSVSILLVSCGVEPESGARAIATNIYSVLA